MEKTVEQQLLEGLKGLETLAGDQAKLIKTNAERTDEAHRILADVMELQKRLQRQRVASLPGMDPRMLKFEPTQKGFERIMRAPMERGTHASDASLLASELQKANDELYLAMVLWAGAKEARINVPELKSTSIWQRFQGLAGELQKALDTTSESEWVPTGMSANLLEAIRLELRVAALFQVINMPTDPWEWPFEVGTPVAQKVSESTTTGNPYDQLTDAARAYTGSSPSDKRIFSAKKMRALELTSREMNDDSMVAVLPFLQSRIVLAIAMGWENAILNGDTAAAHIDEDVDETSGDTATFVDGLRDYALANSTTVDLGTFSTTTLRKVLKKMGTRAMNPRNTVWITGAAGYWAMYDNGDVLTLEKYGQNATLLQGELGRFDNRPIVVSELMREDLDENGYYENAGGHDVTGILCVDRRRWVIGKRPGLGVETERLKPTDQYLVITFDRGTFEHVDESTVPGVGYGINVATT